MADALQNITPLILKCFSSCYMYTETGSHKPIGIPQCSALPVPHPQEREGEQCGQSHMMNYSLPPCAAHRSHSLFLASLALRGPLSLPVLGSPSVPCTSPEGERGDRKLEGIVVGELKSRWWGSGKSLLPLLHPPPCRSIMYPLLTAGELQLHVATQ